MTYIYWTSDHTLVTFTRDGGALSRCGRRVKPPVATGETLRLTHKTCESCLRLVARDAEPRDVANDTVPG